MKNTKKILLFLPLLLLASCNFKYRYVIEGYVPTGNEVIKDCFVGAQKKYENKVPIKKKMIYGNNGIQSA